MVFAPVSRICDRFHIIFSYFVEIIIVIRIIIIVVASLCLGYADVRIETIIEAKQLSFCAFEAAFIYCFL